MKNNKQLCLLLILVACLSVIFSACGANGISSNNGLSDNSIGITLPTEASLPETEETQPEEAEPEETQPQLLEPGGTPMTPQQLARLHWQLAEDEEGWYEAVLASEFTDPKAVNLFQIFGNGVPNASREPGNPDITQEELDHLTQTLGYDPTSYDITRIPRKTIEQVLCTYYGLTPEEAAAVDPGSGLIYYEATDSYYALQNSYGYITPYFHEGYTMPDGTIVVYYCDAFSTLMFYRAVLRENAGVYLVQEVTKADIAFGA